jgi:hypothetical protein
VVYPKVEVVFGFGNVQNWVKRAKRSLGYIPSVGTDKNDRFGAFRAVGTDKNGGPAKVVD